jgi:hypothetical protein
MEIDRFDASFLAWDPNDRDTSAFFELENDGSPFLISNPEHCVVSPGMGF